MKKKPGFNKKIVYLALAVDFLHSGHLRIIKLAKKYGNLIQVESFREQAPVRNDCNVVWDLSVHDMSILNYLLNSLKI